MKNIEIPIENKTKTYRFFEILPGTMSWLILFLPIILSVINPSLAAYFIIMYMVTWLLRAAVMSFRIFQAYHKMQWRQGLNWQKMLSDIENFDKAICELHNKKRDRFERWHYENLLSYKISDQEKVKPSDLFHAIIIAIYNESIEIVEPTVKAVINSNYDTSKIILYLAYEERGGAQTEEVASRLKSKYGDKFFIMKTTKHPKDIPGEVIGKGGNITYAGLDLKKEIEKRNIDPINVLVTTLDADNQPHENYLASIAYAYLTEENRQYKSFQPIPMYTNNIWDAPAPMRLIAVGSSFWWSIQSVRPHLLRNFSSHAQGLRALIDTDFWSTRTIVEDGHQFWRTYFRYDGKHEVIPTFVPIYQDAVLSDTYVRTFKAQFVQLRRWAWGATDVAYVATKSMEEACNAPAWDRIFKFFRLLDSHVSWATAPLILAGAAWAPILFSPVGRESIVAHQLPSIASFLQTVALFGIPAMIYLSFQMLPPRPKHYKRRRSLLMLVQWILTPVVSILYGAFSALYSQTRLMFGKYYGQFDVTKKVKKGTS
ncbi:hypothetical protein DYH10_01715 [Candidatus Saccharibacteria bacterium CPR2]|nr:hypothetical protein [Candidatus Saccharibacteria bacterium CPR2]